MYIISKYIGKSKSFPNKEICQDNYDPEDEVRHEGSYPLEEIKKSEEYNRKLEQTGCIKRKWAICFSYLGSKYQGLQINPGAITVEAILEKALFLAGGIVEANFGNLQKVQWSRAARTDRGVHALAQCCGTKLICPIELDKREIFIDQINSFLPIDIRVIALTKVTKNFNAKISCSRRRYHYLLPTYMLMDVVDVNSKLSQQLKIQGPIVGAVENVYANFTEKESTSYLGKESHSIVYDELKNYRVTKDKIELLKKTLNIYVGTRSYHNFTTSKTPKDKDAMRYIISFDCSEPFTDNKTDTEWVLCSVIGQSFLLNQIRKMIGYAAEVVRGSASISQLEDSFGTNKCDVPMAPGLGLYLDELFFDFYNNKLIRHVEKNSLKSENSSTTDNNESVIKRDSPSNDDNKEESIPTKKLKLEGENNFIKIDNNNNNINKDDQEQGDSVASELIEWTNTHTAVTRLELFRTNIIWPHIFEEDSTNFHYMHFLDYLKVHKFSYECSEWLYKEKKATESF